MRKTKHELPKNLPNIRARLDPPKNMGGDLKAVS